MLCALAVRFRAAAQLRQGAFTLIELLVVTGIIGLLMASGFGLVQGAKRQAAVSQARAELGAIGEMLESYRRDYGDYPQTADSPAKLYQALLGRLGPSGLAITGRSVMGTARIPLRDPAHPAEASNRWVDPWGREYQYIFYTRTTDAGPLIRGYVLYSFGAREAAEVVPTRADVMPEQTGEAGGVVSASELNAQNIYVRP